VPASPPADARAWGVLGAGGQARIAELPIAGGADVHALFDALPLGVYSGLRSFGRGRLLALEHHLDRTARSMAMLGWAEPLDRAALERGLALACAIHAADEVRVRFDVLARSIEVGGEATRLLVALARHRPVPAELLARGVRLVLARDLRRPEPRIKRARFVLERRPHPLAERDAFDALLLDEQGCILEGTSCNFFGVQRGRLVTAGDGVLEGVTQRILAEAVLPRLGIPLERRRLALAEVASLDGAFLTSSTRGVVPVCGIEAIDVGGGAPGLLVRRIADAYDAYADAEARAAH
jgi:branched-subunit amino acid aminotransferase/4-amino-4-deoxychorismate lyase